MSGLRAGAALSPPDFATLRRRAMFECGKWDVQVEDIATLSRFPLVLSADEWGTLAGAAEALAAELIAAEAELLARPELQDALALPGEVRALLRDASRASPGIARFVRFDFHPTPDGWRISEANCDVPGGFVEAAGVAALMAAHRPECVLPGDPAEALADALFRKLGRGAAVGLVHATAYTDDRQVMLFVAEKLAARGLAAMPCSPLDLTWERGIARCAANGGVRELDALVRFFPAEWLPNLPRASGWKNFFRDGRTRAANPGSALLAQSKRFPLVWDRMRTPLPAWRELLPETRDPRDVDWEREKGWILKPAMGRVGEGVGIRGVTKEWRAIAREAKADPAHWVAQRRFGMSPVETPDGAFHPCIGVFTVNGHAAGAYGRLARDPLVDHRAQDVSVLVEPAPLRAIS